MSDKTVAELMALALGQFADAARVFSADALPKTKQARVLEQAIRRVVDSSLEAAKQEPQWVSVSERMPDDVASVICCQEGTPDVCEGYYEESMERWYDQDSEPLNFEVTHWMPLPAAPSPGSGT